MVGFLNILAPVPGERFWSKLADSGPAGLEQAGLEAAVRHSCDHCSERCQTGLAHEAK
jgi:hypothetical protein